MKKPIQCPKCQHAFDSTEPEAAPPQQGVEPTLAVQPREPLDESYTRFARRDKKRFAAVMRRVLAAGFLLAAAAGLLYLLTAKPKKPPTNVVNLPANGAPTTPPVRRRSQPPAAPNSTRAVLNAIEESVVRIESGPEENSTILGTGFVADASGLIATNYHVVAEATHCRVRFRSGAYYDVLGYAAVSQQSDMALLQISEPPPNLEPLPLAESPPSPLTKVFAIGHPHGVAYSIHSGAVSRGVRSSELSQTSRRFLQRHLGGSFELAWIQHTAAISEGNSGGPLLNEQGRAVGVNTWVNRQTGFSYALNVSYLQELLAQPRTEPAPLERYATAEARVSASLKRLSPSRVLRLLDEMKAIQWRPQTEADYAAMQEMAWVLTLSQASSNLMASDVGFSEETREEMRLAADRIEASLREQTWTDFGAITLINEFAADHVSRPMAGVCFFGAVQRTVDGDNGARGALLRLAGYRQSVFVRLDGRLDQLEPGTQILVVGVNQNGRVVRFGENPLRLTTAPQIAVGLILRLE